MFLVGGGDEAGEVGGGGGCARGGAGAAVVNERAGAAVFAVVGRRGAGGGNHGADGFGAGEGFFAELFCEGNVFAAAGFAVVERAGGDFDGEHFFEAEGLGAELHGVDVVGFGVAAFVFDGEGAWRGGGWRGGVAVEFDDVSHALESVAAGLEWEGAGDADAGAGFAAAGVRAFVQDAAFGCEGVFIPDAFDVNERALSRAEGVVLERGDEDGFGGGGHAKICAQTIAHPFLSMVPCLRTAAM